MVSQEAETFRRSLYNSCKYFINNNFYSNVGRFYYYLLNAYVHVYVWISMSVNMHVYMFVDTLRCVLLYVCILTSCVSICTNLFISFAKTWPCFKHDVYLSVLLTITWSTLLSKHKSLSNTIIAVSLCSSLKKMQGWKHRLHCPVIMSDIDSEERNSKIWYCTGEIFLFF